MSRCSKVADTNSSYCTNAVTLLLLCRHCGVEESSSRCEQMHLFSSKYATWITPKVIFAKFSADILHSPNAISNMPEFFLQC